MDTKLSEILAPYRGQRSSLIALLQKTQEELGYISEEAVTEIARLLDITANEIYGVASFYAQFRFKPQGKHVFKVCQGTACHVRGSHRILEGVEQELGIQPGDTTPDRKFGLERVACVGCCALAPVMIVDETVHAQMTPAGAKKIIAEIDKAD
ncbi:MAG: NADH-quinone oxidoreductase subunit NuoE [Chloroflexi bacterium]|nr:NADH-quinone oxidoreductase subunit NuoE [Chloroflexota bacterium]